MDDTKKNKHPENFDDIERYNQPIELEHVDLSDTTGLLDEEEIDDDNHPMINAETRRRGPTPSNISRNVRISHGVLILFIIFFIGAIILISYQMLVKPLLPKPPVPTPTPTIETTNRAYIQRSWPASLCLSSKLEPPCDKFSSFTDFIITGIGRTFNNSQCGPKGNFEEKRDVPPEFEKFWAAPYSIATYWNNDGHCMATSVEKDQFVFVAKDHFSSLQKLLNDLDTGKIEARINVTLTSKTPNNTITIDSSKLMDRLQFTTAKQTFFECTRNNSSAAYLTKITMCIQALVKGTQAIYAPATCPEEFFTQGVARQNQTCGQGEIYIVQQQL
jgi:hypothetical protein